MDKVLLPKEVADAIDTISRLENWRIRLLESILTPRSNLSKEMTVVDDWADREYKHFDILLQALVNGYEVEQTPEEKVRELFEQGKKFHKEWHNPAVVNAITDTLDALGIKIDGVNA